MRASLERDLRCHLQADGDLLVFPFLWGGGFRLGAARRGELAGPWSERLQRLWAAMWAVCVASYAASLQSAVWESFAPFAAAAAAAALPAYFACESLLWARRGRRPALATPLAWRLAPTDFLAALLRRQRLNAGAVATQLLLPLSIAAGLPPAQGQLAAACSGAAFALRHLYGWQVRGRLAARAPAAGPRGAGRALPCAGAVLALLATATAATCLSLAAGLAITWHEVAAANA